MYLILLIVDVFVGSVSLKQLAYLSSRADFMGNTRSLAMKFRGTTCLDKHRLWLWYNIIYISNKCNSEGNHSEVAQLFRLVNSYDLSETAV